MSYLISLSLLLLLAVIFYRYVQKTRKSLLKQKKELQQIKVTKNRLFAIIELEMRKPILVFRDISKKIDFLIDQKEYQTLKKFGQQLDNDAVTLNLFLENLLNWAKTQKDDYLYQPQPIPIKQILEEIQYTFLPITQEQNIPLITHFSESAHINADLDSLMLLLKKLIFKVIQRAEKNEELSITILPEPNQVKIFIKCLSINQEFQKKFELASTITKKNKALLDIIFLKELIQLNRGSIQFTPNSSAESKTFLLTFPRA